MLYNNTSFLHKLFYKSVCFYLNIGACVYMHIITMLYISKLTICKYISSLVNS